MATSPNSENQEDIRANKYKAALTASSWSEIDTSGSYIAGTNLFPSTGPSNFLNLNESFLQYRQTLSSDVKETKEWKDLEKEFHKFQKSVLRQNRNSYILQWIISIVIASVVLLIIAFSLYYTSRQLEKALQIENFTTQGENEPATNIEKDTVSISAKEIVVSSSITGVIILTLALVFFFLYIKYVYKVEKPDLETALKAKELYDKNKSK